MISAVWQKIDSGFRHHGRFSGLLFKFHATFYFIVSLTDVLSERLFYACTCSEVADISRRHAIVGEQSFQGKFFIL